MRWGLIGVAVLALAGCEDDAAVRKTADRVRTVDLARVEELIEQDLENHQAGVDKAAAKLAPGFAVADPAKRESQMRAALRILQQPKKGIDEFVASPMSFLAALDVDGVVIARDRSPDRMKGQDYKSRFDVVQRQCHQQPECHRHAGKTDSAGGQQVDQQQPNRRNQNGRHQTTVPDPRMPQEDRGRRRNRPGRP